MRVDVQMYKADDDKGDREFHIKGVIFRAPDNIITSLRTTLVAASAIWPQLAKYEIRKKPISRR